jgi:hypothetical protein
MNSIGWEIRPVGWLLIVLLVGLIIEIVINKGPYDESNQAQEKGR